MVTHTYPCILYKFEVSCFELPLTDTDNISGVGLESLFLRTWTRTRMSMTRTRTLGTRLKTAQVHSFFYRIVPTSKQIHFGSQFNK